MFNIIQFINLTFGDEHFFFLSELVSLASKLYLLSLLLYSHQRPSTSKKLSALVIIFLIGIVLNDITWVIIMVRNIFFLKQEYTIITCITRIGWAYFTTQYQALCLFLAYLTEKKFRIKKYHGIFLFLNGIISLGFLYLAFFKFNISSKSEETLWFEVKLIQAACFCTLPLVIISFYHIIKKLFTKTLPKILTQQLKIFVIFFIAPHIVLEFITNKIVFPYLSLLINLHRYALLNLSTILCSYGVYYCCKHMIQLRFLNNTDQVASKDKFIFINDFREILERLGKAITLNELAPITHSFFTGAFDIPYNKVKLYIRNVTQNNSYDTAPTAIKIENFLIEHTIVTSSVAQYLYQTKIVIKDEIEFSNFYNEQPERTILLEFLDTINTDLFLPIYENQFISGYIVVERNARHNKLFNDTQQDEILVFAHYLSTVIKILKHPSLELVLQTQQELKDELHHKYQQIGTYKAAMKLLSRADNERKIGTIFHKGHRFIFANQAARDLTGIDINTNRHNPLAQSFRQLVQSVRDSQTTRTMLTQDSKGDKLTLVAFPDLDNDIVIITVYHTDIGALMKAQLPSDNNLSAWDYRISLEATHSGQLINQLIPGKTEVVYDFKISLLATALSQKAVLLELTEDDSIDSMVTVEILHYITLRQKLHVLKLVAPEKNNESAFEIFGINPLFETKESTTEALLKKLDVVGTLFIQNIHFLQLETQHALAEFIAIGYYNNYKSNRRHISDVRIICSTIQNLEQLAAEGLFSKALLNELRPFSLNIPSSITLADTETIEQDTIKNIFDASAQDKSKLLNQRALKLYKQRIELQTSPQTQSRSHIVYDIVVPGSEYGITDPELARAISLGKKALRDPQAMTMLWNKFKNQKKIATLLRVNRSSVNRRCQEYKLYADN
jgi:Sigma-54 interaction domain